jgi:type I restriction enzyme, R subunit
VVLIPRLRAALERLNALLVLDWRKRSGARARIRIAIEDTLDDGLPRAYTKEVYRSKCKTLFEHVYESCFGDGQSVFLEMA